MTIEIAIVFVLLLATFFAMTTEKLPPDITALCAMGVLLIKHVRFILTSIALR